MATWRERLDALTQSRKGTAEAAKAAAFNILHVALVVHALMP